MYARDVLGAAATGNLRDEASAHENEGVRAGDGQGGGDATAEEV